MYSKPYCIKELNQLVESVGALFYNVSILLYRTTARPVLGNTCLQVTKVLLGESPSLWLTMPTKHHEAFLYFNVNPKKIMKPNYTKCSEPHYLTHSLFIQCL